MWLCGKERYSCTDKIGQKYMLEKNQPIFNAFLVYFLLIIGLLCTRAAYPGAE